MKTFRIERDTRPPEPFRFEYKIAEVEKVEVPDPDGGPSRFEERETGRWVWTESQVFHAYTSAPTGVLLDAESDPAAFSRGLDAVIVEADEFRQILRDPAARIDPYRFGEVIEWVVGLAADRPTTKPSS